MTSAAPRLAVLLNPAARGGRAAAMVAPVREWLGRHVPGAPLLVPASVTEADAALRALPPGHRVVVAGGDGTLHRLLPALLAGGHELALLPCGTGNDTARALGVHRMSPIAALEVALKGQPLPFDLGELRVAGRGGVPFASSMAAGFDAAVANRALRMPRALPGMARYLAATLVELRALRGSQLHVRADGADVHAGAALFASTLNTPTFGAGLPAVPQARIDDGQLDLLLAGRFGRLGALGTLPLLLAGLHLRHPRVRTMPYRTLSVRASAPMPLAGDGEPIEPAAQFEIVSRPAAIRAIRAMREVRAAPTLPATR